MSWCDGLRLRRRSPKKSCSGLILQAQMLSLCHTICPSPSTQDHMAVAGGTHVEGPGQDRLAGMSGRFPAR